MKLSTSSLLRTNLGFMEQMRAIIPSPAAGPNGSFESYVEDSLMTPSALAAENLFLMDYMTRLSIHYK